MTRAKVNKAITFALAFVAAGIFVFGNAALLLFDGAKLQYVEAWGLPLLVVLGTAGFAFGWKKRKQ